jgi:hypothetical protein
MAIIKFSYDLEKDLSNYDNNYIHRRFPDYGRGEFDTAQNLFPSLKRKIEVSPEDEKLKIVEEYLRNNFYKKEIISQSISALENYWVTIEKDYFERLNKYMKIEKPLEEIKAYFTTLSICPYNPKDKSFFISLYYSLPHQAKTIMHESMHLVFRNNYEDYLIKCGVDGQGILDITEALTALLNWEFGDLLLLPEFNNKPSTMDLQEKVVELCKKKKDFQYILDELIKMRS